MALGVPIRKMTRFFAAGLPAALFALALNVLLVREFQWPKPLAYPVVLVVQLSLNFMVCRLLVFSFAADHPILPQYARFMSGMAMFRVADWLAYTALVEVAGLGYVAVQAVNIMLFSLLKYRYAESAGLRGARDPVRREALDSGSRF